MSFEKGDWIEIEDRIFEVQTVFDKAYSVREILYKEPTPKLYYGPTLMISFRDFIFLEDGKLEWERYLAPFMRGGTDGRI